MAISLAPATVADERNRISYERTLSVGKITIHAVSLHTFRFLHYSVSVGGCFVISFRQSSNIFSNMSSVHIIIFGVDGRVATVISFLKQNLSLCVDSSNALPEFDGKAEEE